MSESITILFNDGTKREFKHEGRAGGGYTKTIKYEGGFAIVQDEWYNKFSFPESSIKEIQVKEGRW